MKFCKNLQQIVEIADPEWAPYWTNYKMLKVCAMVYEYGIKTVETVIYESS